MNSDPESAVGTPSQRQALFLRLAARPEGVTVDEAYSLGIKAGDSVTREAYYNIARRLAHKAVLFEDATVSPKRYRAATGEGYWIDEEHIHSIVDPDYPLVALAVLRESHRQAAMIPESEFVAARKALESVKARDAAFEAIVGYAEDLVEHCRAIGLAETHPSTGESVAKLKTKVQDAFHLLKDVAKFGLGLSKAAVNLPSSPKQCISRLRDGKQSIVDEHTLRRELSARFGDECLINPSQPETPETPLITVAIDGSTRGGVLYDPNETTDFSLSGGPIVNVNTAVAYAPTFRLVTKGREGPVCMRLPEKPEDMQRADNRFTIMAQLFYPDQTDGSYIHSVWNAMDLLEARAANRVLTSWVVPGTDKPMPPADAVLRDGTIIPHDRDSNHYSQGNSYGDIVRQLYETNWDIARRISDGHSQSLIGVVKEAHVRVLAPIFNFALSRIVARGEIPNIKSWPLDHLNRLPDQVLATRILCAGRKSSDPWIRTCIYLRPFFAATDFADKFSGQAAPSEIFTRRGAEQERKIQEGTDEDVSDFWRTFQKNRDPYVKMLDRVQYANMYVGFSGRADSSQLLPRIEVMIPDSSTAIVGQSFPTDILTVHVRRCLAVLKQDGLEVAKDHSMFGKSGQLDIMPASLIRAHETVKFWAEDLILRTKEYLAATLMRVGFKLRTNRVEVRRLKRSELDELSGQLTRERDLIAEGKAATGDE